jgi:hypothetical protein
MPISGRLGFFLREENMKAAVRSVLSAVIVSSAVLWSVTVHVPVAHPRAAHIRWDIAAFSTPPDTLGPDGADSARAEDNTGITLTGSGTFVAPAGGAGTSSAVTGGGTWQTFDKMPEFVTEKGTYKVTGLVRWEEAPGTFIDAEDAIAPQDPLRAGLAVLRVRYSDGEEGVLTVSCAIGGSPPSIFEGITATKGFVDYWNRIPGLTLFHALRSRSD